MREGLKVKQEMSKYQVVRLSSVGPGKKKEKKSVSWKLENQLNQGHNPDGFIKREASRSGGISTKAKQRLGRVHSVE